MLTSLRFWSAFATLVVASSASSFGAVMLLYSDGDSTPTAATVPAGGTFSVSVILSETATTDDVSGVDYRPQISTNGSGRFRILSRTSTLSTFTPANADANPLIAPGTLSPTNGTANYGGDRNGAADLKGVATYSVATYSIQVLAGTAVGTYTLGFAPGADFTGPGPNFPATTLSGAGLGSFAVTVPEPTSLLAASTLGLAGVCRRRRSAR